MWLRRSSGWERRCDWCGTEMLVVRQVVDGREVCRPCAGGREWLRTPAPRDDLPVDVRADHARVIQALAPVPEGVERTPDLDVVDGLSSTLGT